MQRRIITSLAMLAVACGKPQGSPSESEGKPIAAEDGKGGDDNESPSMPVPMGVLDPRFLVDVRTRIEAYHDGGFGSDALAGASALLGQSDEVIQDFAGSMDALATAMEATFGENGFFANRVVDVPRAQTSGLAFKIKSDARPNAPDYAIVSADGEQPTPYQVQLYRESAAKDYVAFATFRFGDGDEQNPGTIKVLLFGAPTAAGQQVMTAELDPNAQTARLVFGPADPKADKTPLRNAMVFKTAGEYSEIRGARTFIKSNAAAFDPKFGARTHQAKTDDALLFRLKMTKTGDRVQQYAYVPKEEAKTVANSPAKAFDDNRVSRYGREMIRNVLRTDTINPSCATSGTAFGAPADVCQANASLTDVALLKKVAEACASSASVVMPLFVDPTGKDASTAQQVDVCRLQRDLVDAFDGVLFFKSGTDGAERIAPSSASEELISLAKSLAKDKEFMDWSALETKPWPELVTREASAFAGARPEL